MVDRSLSHNNYHQLTSELMTYALVNWDRPGRKLRSLKKYIKDTKNMNVELNELGQYIRKTRYEIGQPLELSRSRAVVITNNKKIEILKFGSAMCPKCGNYKNYFRECPICNYIEFY
jgi:hypothetical protein